MNTHNCFCYMRNALECIYKTITESRITAGVWLAIKVFAFTIVIMFSGALIAVCVVPAALVLGAYMWATGTTVRITARRKGDTKLL
jgi:ABC-type bacteriocin/lantibiotic exporter with double-glycine peptidase domain